MDAKDWIIKLELLPHPEGGFYKEVYRSHEIVPGNVLPENFGGNRNISTAIYYLLEGDNFSAFHRIKSDEIWHFYYGTAVRIYTIDANGKLGTHIVGNTQHEGELPMLVIPKNVWFAAELIDKKSFSLVGCTVSPGFHFEDFEMANKEQMKLKFPEHSILIERMCR